MFANIVTYTENWVQVEENMEKRRYMLERRGMKVNHNKTEKMFVNERKASGTVRFQGVEVEKVHEFKYSR